LWIKKWDADLIREQYEIPGCRALLRLDKEVRRQGELLSFETRYFVSSLDPDKVSAAEFQAIILGHWEVENCLHMLKDRDFLEDKHVIDAMGWGKTWTVMTSMALSLTRLLRGGERTLREIWECCLADPTTTAEKLGFKKTC
jgi:predicted transposase YbfD/YdcC